MTLWNKHNSRKMLNYYCRYVISKRFSDSNSSLHSSLYLCRLRCAAPRRTPCTVSSFLACRHGDDQNASWNANMNTIQNKRYTSGRLLRNLEMVEFIY